MAENEHTLRKNPSRKECEDIIRRILMTEMLEKGKNEHFKTAADFMKYFESLYPASDSLTKQVQRAIKSLGMPKDANGYFIINKTAEQLDQDHELTFMLQKSHAHITSLDNCETLFLATDSNYKSYLLQLLQESKTCQGKYLTILDSTNGLLFYTKNATQLRILLESLMHRQ
ncbi:MAG: hypothetical protein EGR77_05735 [Pseudobutyrivibrio sp.]|nr:hypothetical protein [Pseudobutyrivibrio sp.]